MAGFSRKDFFTNENIRLWEYFHALPEKVQDILKSREIARYIFAIEQKYHLNDAQTEELSRSVRRYFFREVSEDAFVQHIAQVCGIPPQEGLRMLREIVNITPVPQRDEEEESEPQQPQRHLVPLPLEQALRQYPAIKDQTVTGVQIFMRSLPQPLRPSVKNWIMVYERVLGASKHTAIERGEFVFRAEPTRGLSQDDRQKLAMMLKSRDEGVPLTIDRDQRMIVFDAQPQTMDDDSHVVAPQKEEDVRDRMQSREGVVRRNEYFPTDTAHYTIRNAVQSVRSSGGFVPQQRSMYVQKPPQPLQQATQPQAQTQQIQKPAEAQPTWGQTPMMRPQGGVPSTSSTHRSPQGLLESQKRPSQTQSMPKKVTQSNTIGIGTQKQQRVAAPQHKSVEAPRTIGLQSGYGTMTPVVQSPDNLPAVQASSVHGVISFSSNHNLPIERKKHHTLQSTKKYLSPRAEN